MDETQKIRETLDVQGRTQDWLADQLDISASYLTLILQGKRPWPEGMKRRIARVLGVPERFIFLSSDVEPVITEVCTDVPTGT